MNIGFISDIHGNYEALKAVLAELDKMNISEIYCLGDVVGYYSQVNECCNELRSRKIPCIMGNHDWYMAGNGFALRSKSANDCIAYQRKVITSENVQWLKTFPIQREVHDIQMLHGGWSDPIDEYLLEPTEEYFNKIKGTVFLSGHTHIQTIRQFGEKKYCNPGSVGMPRDNNPEAAFAVYTDNIFTLHRVPYDIQKVCDLMAKTGFNNYYYGGLLTGARNLKRP
ncbi:MAG: phosphatase [Candidatus Kerfeldbacteria bacterium CG08_land_8_20_14_0_20_40_16]|uniref:Phosphoesterase n=1 Tax=Candidatus Kerfeldbacteria bacterium CG08_land_8_20_14_0_20_40_16 TaxID=2014244 RepID=A0A2H0YXU6_9BACT|nr:MAG: phosphatase [Candidatus Kerfeldbacteria bacterium CG08_land_8_20_14_0_20_40_16]